METEALLPVDDLGTPSPHKGSFATKRKSAASLFATGVMVAYGENKTIALSLWSMQRIFGFDIGTTSIGFAVIDHDDGSDKGKIHRLGVRIFPEARDPKGTPLNQDRRQARLRRRQLRRRRERRRDLGEILHKAGLLPERDTSGWHETMRADPYTLRKKGFEGSSLTPYEIGRAIYHLGQRRHFKGRDLDEPSEKLSEDDAEEKKAESARENTLQALMDENKTLGAWLADRSDHERKRGIHATRKIVELEFDRVWAPLVPKAFRAPVREAIFFQRPVFWRLNTLGHCRFIPSARLCPKGSWLSQQRRMLEKLNNLAFAGSEQRCLDEDERQAILANLQTQASMTWPGVRRSLARLFRDRGIPGEERALKFNLEEGGEGKLLGNSIEAKLADIFGNDWQNHPHKQKIRDSVPQQLWQADYEEVGGQRVVILPASKRTSRRTEAMRHFASEFGLSDEQAAEIVEMKLPSGWEPYSIDALKVILPYLETGTRFGEIVSSPDWEEWRKATFPDREQPTGEIFDRLPSPAEREERKRLAGLRNPTVARTRNELRKVVNNLIEIYGKPDLIRIELARDIGNSKRQREEKLSGIRRHEKRRKAAREKLEKNNISEPSRTDIEKWMLWEECKRRCPYTGDSISFDALFHTGEFDVEHIWPRSRSLNNGFGNKTLCRKDVNAMKGNQTPYEYFQGNQEEWLAFTNRLDSMKASGGGVGLSPGKIKRFLAPDIPENFASRQLNDTGYAAREAVAYLNKLWPDTGPDGPVRVFAVQGRVTAHLRRLWGLNNILADDGEKNRADHRHHAIDALTVACCHPGMTQKLSRYWQDEDNPRALQPRLTPPWETIRSDAEKAAMDIVVSHRVRKKVSGPLHKETVYGDTGEDDASKGRPIYRYFVTRKNVEMLSKSTLQEKNKDLWPDQKIRDIIKGWVDQHGGDPKKAFPPYPKKGRKGPEIRKVRLRMKQQMDLMASVSTGHADLGNNHHIAIYRLSDNTIGYEVVSLLEASRRIGRREPVVCRDRGDGAKFIMSLSPGDSLQFTKDGEAKVRIVESVWTSSVVVMVDHDDAVGASKFRPNANSIAKGGARKVSVDPVGRVRPAND